MHSKITTTGKVTDEGVMTIPSSVRAEIVEAYRGRQFKITAEEIVAIRSILFNSFYWVCIMQHAHAAFTETDPRGYKDLTAGQVHKYMKTRFLFNGVRFTDKETGVTEWLIEPTTTTLSNKEFIDYCEDIRNFLFDVFGVNIDEKEAKDYYSTLDEPKHWKDLSESQLKKIA